MWQADKLYHVVGILHLFRKVFANGMTENCKVGLVYPGLKTEITNVKNSVLNGLDNAVAKRGVFNTVCQKHLL